MTATPRFTAAEKAECARRELAFRQRVYAGLVQRGRLNARKAERELALMQEIADDYRIQAESSDLFSEEAIEWHPT